MLLGVLLAAFLGAGAFLIGGRPHVELDWVDLGIVGATLLAAGYFFLPGFPYAYGDKDPGLYVAHAFAIARTGDVSIPDEVRSLDLETREHPKDEHPFPGVRPAPGEPDAVTSQFFHFDSALMATVKDLAGRSGMFNMTPVLAMLSVTILTLAARRAAGTPVAVVLSALLVTSMLQVWQAKYPSTEIPAQLFLSGALLGGVLAVERGWASGAFLAGLLVGTGFLTRPDGFLYLVLATGMLAVAIAVGRADRRAAALGAGLAAALPYALWNAYGARSDYSASNKIPGLGLLALVCAGLLAAGAAVHLLQMRRRNGRVGAHGPTRGDLSSWLARRQLPIGIALTTAAGLVLLVLWFRKDLFDTLYQYNAIRGEKIRDMNVLNLRWLALFMTIPGLVAMWLGVAVLTMRRSTTALWLLLVPGTVLLPLYLWNARVSMRMMWWGRRFVPAVVPAVLLLVALALGWAVCDRRWVVRIAGAAGVAALVIAFASQSGPLRDHREMDGSWQIAEAIAKQSGQAQGVFLFTAPLGIYDPMLDSPIMVWWAFDQITSGLPASYDIDTLDDYRQAFPGQPIFLVLHDKVVPPWLPAERFDLAGVVSRKLTFWEEWPWGEPPEDEPSQRPDEAETLHQRLTIWRLV